MSNVEVTENARAQSLNNGVAKTLYVHITIPTVPQIHTIGKKKMGNIYGQLQDIGRYSFNETDYEHGKILKEQN